MHRKYTHQYITFTHSVRLARSPSSTQPSPRLPAVCAPKPLGQVEGVEGVEEGVEGVEGVVVYMVSGS